mgnify:CR=1 FL=1
MKAALIVDNEVKEVVSESSFSVILSVASVEDGVVSLPRARIVTLCGIEELTVNANDAEP